MDGSRHSGGAAVSRTRASMGGWPAAAGFLSNLDSQQLLTYDNLTETGSTYATLKPGADCKVSYEETRDPELGYNPNVSTIPRIVYFTCKNLKTRVQTSGIETTTGMLHILANPHLNNSRTLDNDGNVLFFRNK